MNLLQIKEPGSVNKVNTVNVVGIDLGTTNSLVARVDRGTPVILADQEGQELLPSVVYFPEEGVPIVGQSARAMAKDDADNTISSVKRLMGVAPSTSANSEDTSSSLSSVVRLQTRAGLQTPQEISAWILRAIKARALMAMERLDGAVITVPAYFDDNQRQATRDAARLAGIPVLRLLSEPTAAALAYGIGGDRDGVVAVYDLGGGTFDVSILKLEKDVFQVLATAGDTQLGGDDIDAAICDWIEQQTGTTDNRTHNLERARDIKERLSVEQEITIESSNGNVSISQQQLHLLMQPIIDTTIRLCRQAIADSGIQLTDVNHLVLVGGSTRTPAVIQNLKQAFPEMTIYNSLNPDTTVALGAALQAETLAGSGEERLLLDVLPLSLGIETIGSLVERIIPRNSTIPISKTQEFTTWTDGQTAMLIHVVQGERDKVEDCRSLAHCELRGIPQKAAGSARVEVTFSVDADGLLQVTARETSTGIQTQIDVRPSSGLHESEVQRMLDEAWQQADADKEARSYQQAVVEAQRLIAATESALHKDGDMLTDKEQQGITDLLQQLQQQIAVQADVTEIEKLTKQLTEETDNFAAQRMDKNIAAVLSGTSITNDEDE